MPQLPNFDPVQYLVSKRFPAARELRFPPTLSPYPSAREALAYEERNQLIARIDAYEEELRSKTPAEIQLLCDEARASELAETTAKAKLETAKAEREERERFFNQPRAMADFVHWSKATYWTLDEATALSFGRAPEVVAWENVHGYVKVSAFAHRYSRLRDLALRAKHFQQLYDPVLPGIYIAWAKRNEIDFPADLEAAVLARGIQVADWKSLYDEISAAFDKTRQERDAALSLADELRARVESLQTNNRQLASGVNEVVAQRGTAQEALARLQSEFESAKLAAKGLGARERESLLRLVIGMAVKGYGYDPAQRRSDKLPEIVGDLEKVGVPLDADTVRKWLKEAAELLPPSEVE